MCIVLLIMLQVQDETQRMNEWFARQELGLSQKETLKDRTNNAMTSSIPGYESGFLASTSTEMTPEKSNTLPLPRRKHNHEDPRGRQQDRRRGLTGTVSETSMLSNLFTRASINKICV